MRAPTLFFLTACMSCVAFSTAEDFYSSKYDNFDIEGLLSNNRVLKNYIKCLMDSGPCTSEGKDFKRVLPEILETSCEKCTPAQRQILRRFLKFIKSHKTEDWEKLVQKYDLEGKYEENIKKFEYGTD